MTEPDPVAVTTFVRKIEPVADPQRKSTLSPDLNPESETAAHSPACTELATRSDGLTVREIAVEWPESSVAVNLCDPVVDDGTANEVIAAPDCEAPNTDQRSDPRPCIHGQKNRLACSETSQIY